MATVDPASSMNTNRLRSMEFIHSDKRARSYAMRSVSCYLAQTDFFFV